ncbi:MAG: 23S rRNA (adenine(1618)-N(6))-methyltransferase RlmF [Crocinitomicaceae bacterium]|nr:23S rRNA (adenine(1618)-N(6))-methyltransferase RlmF [Crocinitomicaceae bacterium]
MSTEEKATQEKTRLHIRNKNRERYDLEALLVATPALKEHVKPNKHGEDSVDFASPIAVKLLNQALLSHYYGIKNWEFPDDNLCPPIPGRADYLHYMADLLAESNYGAIPRGEKINVLDIGVGANCIYPVIGVAEYGWKFIGSDIDPKSIEVAQNIVDSNPELKGKIEIKLQADKNSFFNGIISDLDEIDVTICNPPFHSSNAEAQKGSRRKVRNLTGKREKAPVLNFAGIGSELICEGGEFTFITNMIRESKTYSKNCFWFTTLVSKISNLNGIYHALDRADAVQVKTIQIGTGNKSSRIVCWTFLEKDEQKAWKDLRWNK